MSLQREGMLSLLTFWYFLVIQKYDKGKVTLSISRANNVRPYHPKPEFHQQTKEKSDTPSAFSFAKAGAKEKAIKKKTPEEDFALCGARQELRALDVGTF